MYTGSMTGVYYICDPFDFWPNWDPPVAVDKLTIFTPMWKVVISNWFCLPVCSSVFLSVCLSSENGSFTGLNSCSNIEI